MTQQLSLPFEQPIDREAQALVERCQEAAWLIDPGQGRVVAASADGAALLALEQDRGGWLMDAAMPALTRLREIANAATPVEASVSERLLFWTPLGARNLACEIRRAEPAEQPMLLLCLWSSHSFLPLLS